MYVAPLEFAELTGLPVNAIRQWCKQGLLPHINAGKRFYINKEMAIEYLNQRSTDHAVKLPKRADDVKTRNVKERLNSLLKGE